MTQVATRRTVRVRRVRRAVVMTSAPAVPCSSCGKDVPGVTPDEAAGLLQATREALERLLQDGAVHSVPTAAGQEWICRDSLFRRSK